MRQYPAKLCVAISIMDANCMRSFAGWEIITIFVQNKRAACAVPRKRDICVPLNSN